MSNVHQSPAEGNLGPVAVRPDPPPIPPRRRPLAEILADHGLTNGAKLLARHLDGLCLSHGKWAAWPKVSTIADALGWGGEPRAFRKRVERAFRELIDAGDVARPRLGELVAWHEADGAGKGIAWPKQLRRNLCRSAAICVLGWKLAEAEAIPPIFTACDIGVAPTSPPGDVPAPPDVASHTPGMSHRDTPGMSHPQNVRTPNVRTEPETLNVAALAPGGGDREADAREGADGEIAPPADPTRRHRAWDVVEKLWRRGVRWRAGDDGRPAWFLPTSAIDPPTPLAEDVMRELAPEVRAELRSRGVPIPVDGQVEGPGPVPGAKPAPKVPPAVQAEVRSRLGRLRHPETTRAEVASTAKALAAAMGPHRDLGMTEATFLKMCGQVRSGEGPISEAIVQDAFEGACRQKGARSRGAVFIDLVGKFIAEGKSRGRSPAGGAP